MLLISSGHPNPVAFPLHPNCSRTRTAKDAYSRFSGFAIYLLNSPSEEGTGIAGVSMTRMSIALL